MGLRRLTRRLVKAAAPAQRWLKVNVNQVIKGRPKTDPARAGKFMIVRVMGNDLFPRHGGGQLLTNLRFILENEPEFENCSKLFILNRLFDDKILQEAKDLIEASPAEAIVIPFEPEAYARTGWEVESFGGVDFFRSPEFLNEPEQDKNRMVMWACAPKVVYAMNVNGARNVAIKAGQDRAEWTAVLDGSCIFTPKSFAAFRAGCMSSPFAPYMIVPMHRLEDNADYAGTEPNVNSGEEPQIAFHQSATATFDERFPYGMRNKTKLLKSLRVPGAWNDWKKLPWMPSDDDPVDGRHFFRTSEGGVFRLSSGGRGLEVKGAHHRRYGARSYSIITTVRELNTRYGTRDPEFEDVVFQDFLTGDDPSESQPPTSS